MPGGGCGVVADPFQAGSRQQPETEPQQRLSPGPLYQLEAGRIGYWGLTGAIKRN